MNANKILRKLIAHQYIAACIVGLITLIALIFIIFVTYWIAMLTIELQFPIGVSISLVIGLIVYALDGFIEVVMNLIVEKEDDLDTNDELYEEEEDIYVEEEEED